MAARITLHNPRLAAHCSYRSTSDRTGAWRPIGRRTCNVASDPFVTRRGRRRGLRAFRLILVASNGSSLVRSPIWTTALLGLGEALDDDNVGQLGELVRVEQQFAGAIAATHNHPGLLHDRTVDVDGQITNAKGCGSSGGTSGGSGNGAVEVAGFVDAVSFSVEVPGPVCPEVAVAEECASLEDGFG